MEYNSKDSKIIIKLGLIGIISVLITIISDFILIGKPSTAYDFLLSGTESMWDISTARITIGAFIGVVALPFQSLGLVPVYYALKSSGKVLPAIAVISYAHALLMGVAFHISYAFIGYGWKLNHRPDATQITTDLMQQYNIYWIILMVIMTVEILLCSVIYSVVVAKGKTSYPRWMAIFNPALVVAITLPLVFLIPYPIGGYIAPACLNISTILFFILTMVLKRKATIEA